MKDVAVTVTHAVEGGSVVVTVPENATILEIRRSILDLLGEKKLSTVKLVKRAGGGFASFLDSETLSGRTELLSLGREL